MFAVYPLFILFTVVRCEISLSTIFRESTDAVESYGVRKNMEVVLKYYFTTDKEKSIWYHAQKEAKNLFNIDLDEKDLQFLQSLIQNAAAHYDNCLTIDAGPTRSQCFFHLSSYLRDLEIGARWPAATETSIENKAKYGVLYNCVVALNVHLAIISQDNLKYYKQSKVTKTRLKSFIWILRKSRSVLFSFDTDVIGYRLDQLSPAVICEMSEHFWKEFTQSCEPRWYGINRDNATVKGATGSKRSEDTNGEPSEDEYENLEENPKLQIADRIGKTDQSKNKYRVHIYDHAQKKNVFQKYAFADRASRSVMMEALTREAFEARDKLQVKVKEDVAKFINNTYTITSTFLDKTIQFLESNI